MIVAAILLTALVVTGAILYVLHRRDMARHGDDDEAGAPGQPPAQEEGCCGMHITCERDSLLSSVSESVVYYDDEELDRYRGRAASEYNDEEIEQFREVLITLLPEDIAGWARSIQLRGIELPDPVRDELLMIVGEERARRTQKQ